MKSILITGGSGTLGTALVKKLLTADVQRIVVYSRGEHRQETMAKELTDERLRFFIGDVRDEHRLEMAMRDVDTVIHAAALKVVPSCEYNPFEAVQTNIIGAQNVIQACLRTGVARAITTSTDKAVNPINLYGATKLAAEKLFIAANNLSGDKGCRFSVVRYGNVLGSTGSVVPYYRQLAADGASLPITHLDMTRFWITLDQAVEFVLINLMMMRGREIFVPKLPSMKIIDLVTTISDRPVDIIGIRPGEKIHEVLITEDESRAAYDMGDNYIIMPEPIAGDNAITRLVPSGFRYSSDNNTQWLTVEQLREIL